MATLNGLHSPGDNPHSGKLDIEAEVWVEVMEQKLRLAFLKAEPSGLPEGAGSYPSKARMSYKCSRLFGLLLQATRAVTTAYTVDSIRV